MTAVSQPRDLKLGRKLYTSPYIPAQSDKMSPQQEEIIDKISNKSGDSGIVDWNDPKSIKEKNRQILENQMSCDVMFYFGPKHETLKRETLGAHKYILTARSDVFRHLFNGPDVLKSEFEIADLSADSFWEVLRHMYSDDQKLTVLNVVGVLCAADRYDLLSLRYSCLDFLALCLDINNACFLISEVQKYGYHKEEQDILTFIRDNAESVLQTTGLILLSRDLLNQIITFPGLQLSAEVKRQALERWAKHHCQEKQQAPSEENLMDSLQDCLYVQREESSHRFISSTTTLGVMQRYEESIEPVIVEDGKADTDSTDGASSSNMTVSSKTQSSVHTKSPLPSYNMWADLDQVTRLQELYGSVSNDGNSADAISFTVDSPIYLYGFSIYGPKKDGEGRYQINTVFSRKKKVVVLESIQIKGAGVILPVMFERPVKIDAKKPYTLEIYISGPDSHTGNNGSDKVSCGNINFNFSKASSKIKKNRSNVSEGQIPRLYFLPRNKKD